MKLVSRGDTTVVDAYLSPILRRYVDQVAARDAGRAAVLHAVVAAGSPTRSASRARTRSCPVRPAASSAWCAPPARGWRATTGARDRLRHGRNVHRRQPLRRRIRARLRDRGRRRAHARADDEHPHGGCGRRVDPRLRRRAAARRPGQRRRQSRAGVLPARRAADRHRCQRDARQDPAGALPERVRPGRPTQPLDRDVVRRAVSRRWRSRSQRATGVARSPEAIAEGFLQIAVENMANAIKQISVARGYDVTALHAAVLRRRRRPACLPGGRCARHERVFVHPLAGVLSAYGMGLADQSAMREAAVEARARRVAPRRARRPLRCAGRRGARGCCASRAWRRAACQRAARGAPALPGHRHRARRRRRHRHRSCAPRSSPPTGSATPSSWPGGRWWSRRSRSRRWRPATVPSRGDRMQPAAPHAGAGAAIGCAMYSGGRWHDAALVAREQARAGQLVDGPAIIAERNATTVVEPGWRARVHRARPPAARARRAAPSAAGASAPTPTR